MMKKKENNEKKKDKVLKYNMKRREAEVEVEK